MKRVLLALALVGMTAGAAMAQDPTDLSDGVFICHHPPGLMYTSDPFDYCGALGLTTCDGQNNMIPDDAGAVWFIVSNFWEPKTFNAVEYGISYGGTQFALLGVGVCAPAPFLTIEYPAAGDWGTDGSAISIALSSEPYWNGTMVATSWIAGYHYSYNAPGMLSLIPSPLTHFIGWLSAGTMYTPVGIGSMGLGMAGGYACSEPPETWACCLPNYGPCVDMVAADCEAAGGGWMVGAICADMPCPEPPLGACCLPNYGPCQDLAERDCIAVGGEWHAGVLCADFQCPTPPPVWACCFADGSCQDLTEAECGAAGGTWYMDVLCAADPCPQPMACCLPNYAGCQDVYSQGECDALMGVLYPDFICADNPCPTPPVAACCFADYTCQDLTEADCLAGGGVWYPGVLCAAEPCPVPPVWACCMPDCSCIMLTEAECMAQGGEWHVDVDCASEPCAVTPTAPDSWGQIKSIYR